MRAEVWCFTCSVRLQGHKEWFDMKESNEGVRTVLEPVHDSLVTLWLLGCV